MKKSHFQNTNNNPRNILCKRMNLKKCPETCNRAHNINELEISICNKGANCNNTKCPFVHSHQEFNLVNKQNYYEQMYKYTNPYETDRTAVCRYSSIGCKIVKCRKAHTVNELRITECDCFRNNCPFYHIERDAHITKQQYFERMKQHQNVISKSSNEMLCRYVDIGCQRLDCPYENNKIFVYGTQIKDFHTLKKDYIYTLNVCATQELHRRMEAQEGRIKELEAKLEKLITYIYQ